jgi:hypothetical protein
MSEMVAMDDQVDVRVDEKVDARSGRWRRVLRVLPYALIILGCVGLTTFHVWAYPKLGPIDEQAHIDYIFKVRDGHIPQANELMGQKALAEEACRGFDSAYVPPPCQTDGGKYAPESFQFGGVSAAAGHSPYYYAVTVIVATPISWLPGIESFITAVRIATGLWLAAAFCLLYWLTVSAGGSRMIAAFTLTFLACMPQVIHASSTVNPDATALLGGALVLAAVVRRWPRWLLLVIVAMVMLFKATNVLAVLAGALLLFIENFRAIDQKARSLRSTLRAAVNPALMVIVGGAASVAWSTIVKLRTLPEPASYVPIPGTAPTLTGLMVDFFPPTLNPPFAPFFVQSEPYIALAGLGDRLIMAIAVGGALLLSSKVLANRIAWVGLVGMIVGPTVIMLSIWVGAGALYGPPSRYGISLVPFLIVPLMLVTRSLPSRLLLGAYTVTVVAVTLLAISRTPFV